MQEIKKIINDSSKELEDIDNSPFTNEGFVEYRNNISEYIEDLFVESLKISKRNKTELISASHVKSASFYLINKTKSNIKAFYNSVGGLLLGVTVSNLVSLSAFDIKYGNTGIIVIVVMGIVGSFLLSLGTLRN